MIRNLAMAILLSTAAAADRYIAATGDDSRDGSSPATAWRSFERLAQAGLAPGDRILLKGGDRFIGTLTIEHGGEPGRPVRIGSWGDGRAVIAPPAEAHAIVVHDASFVEIADLDLVGPGVDAASQGSGLMLWAQRSMNHGITVRRLRCSGFHARGIELWSEADGAGFSDVLVEDCECSANGEGGMGSWGPCTPGAYAFHRLVVRGSSFHGNRGIVGKRDNHSGNGIILGDCLDALIERCSAWENGDLCRSPVGGPVGIWLCESDRSVIRGCLSYRNRTGPGIPDGGGFDLDGGCTGCVIEDSLSWGNDGAGVLVCQYKGARPFQGNVVRNCISVGDGRAKNNGGIFLWCEEAGSVHETLVAHCTVVMPGGPSQPAAVRLASKPAGLHFRNNLLLATGGADLLREADMAGVDFAGDQWWSADGLRFIRHGSPVAAPSGTTFADPGMAIGELPAVVDAPWCARLAGPHQAIPPAEAGWRAVLTAAGCNPDMPACIGARPLPHYGR